MKLLVTREAERSDTESMHVHFAAWACGRTDRFLFYLFPALTFQLASSSRKRTGLLPAVPLDSMRKN
jgi:hypothetical protein